MWGCVPLVLRAPSAIWLHTLCRSPSPASLLPLMDFLGPDPDDARDKGDDLGDDTAGEGDNGEEGGEFDIDINYKQGVLDTLVYLRDKGVRPSLCQEAYRVLVPGTGNDVRWLRLGEDPQEEHESGSEWPLRPPPPPPWPPDEPTPPMPRMAKLEATGPKRASPKAEGLKATYYQQAGPAGRKEAAPKAPQAAASSSSGRPRRAAWAVAGAAAATAAAASAAAPAAAGAAAAAAPAAAPAAARAGGRGGKRLFRVFLGKKLGWHTLADDVQERLRSMAVENETQQTECRTTVFLDDWEYEMVLYPQTYPPCKGQWIDEEADVVGYQLNLDSQKVRLISMVMA